MVLIASPIEKQNGLLSLSKASQGESKLATTINEYDKILKSGGFNGIEFEKFAIRFHCPKIGKMEIIFKLADEASFGLIESLLVKYPS